MTEVKSANQKPLILIVDDDRFMRVSFQDSLNKAGFMTATAQDGISAIASYKNLRPDMVLLDLLMPGMDGFDICRKIRAIPGSTYTPVLIVTGHSDTEAIHGAFEAGTTDFIAKPVNPDLLVYRVNYMLRASRSMQNLAESKAKLASAQRVARLGNWEWDPLTGTFRGSAETFRILGMDRTPHIFSLDI